MKFDYKQGMQEREKLLIEQGKLLNQITETIKQMIQLNDDYALSADDLKIIKEK